MVSVGSIIGGGFRLLRERPLAVASWSLAYVLVTVLMLFAMRPFFQMQAASLRGAAGGGVPANFGSVMGWLLLVELLAMAVFTVLMTAAQRAVLRPRDSSFGYMRLGMDELRMFGLTLLIVVGSYIGFVIAGIILGLVVVAVGAGGGGFAAVAPLMAIAMIALFALFIWIEVRLSLAFPLTLLRRKIILGEAWRLTRGRFWTLFGAFVVIFLAILLLWVMVAAVTQGAYWSALMRAGGNPQAVQQAAAQQAAAQLAFSPAMIVGWIVMGVVGGLTVALFGGAVATAARLLVHDPDAIAETFA